MKKKPGLKLKVKLRAVVYIKLQLLPSYDKLPERLQEVIDLLAAEASQREIASMMKISHQRVWGLKSAAFMKLGFRVFENGRSRPMSIAEVATKLRIITGKEIQPV